MNKLLQEAEDFIVQNIVRIHLCAMFATLVTTSLKVFKLVHYDWSTAFFPTFFEIAAVTFIFITNFLIKNWRKTL